MANGQPNKPGNFTQNRSRKCWRTPWIPHLLDGRDETFSFFSWEAFRLRQGASPVLTTVPTTPELAGNFSAPGIAPIMDPCGGTVTSGACPNFAGSPTPFPGNVIPTSRLNPTSVALENLWPAANSPCTADNLIGCKNNYAKSYATGGNQNQVVGRMDQTLGTNQRIFFRYTYWNVLDLPQDPLGTGLCQDRCAEKYATSAAAIGYNYNVTPNTIASLNASLSRFAYNRSPNNAGFDLTTIGWPAQFNNVIPSIARTPPTPCVLDYARQRHVLPRTELHPRPQHAVRHRPRKKFPDAVLANASENEYPAGSMTPARMKKNVIIVEDDRGLREQLVEILETAPDIKCLGAFTSAEAALPQVLEKKPDVVLMDIKLPGMSGIQCVAEIKKVAARPCRSSW